MHEKPKLQCTRNYDLFEVHEHNRPQHDDPVLLASMQEVGFMHSSPLQVIRNGQGKLKIIRGHHRFHYAKRLALPVWYVIDDSQTDLFKLEAVRQGWSIPDYARSRASDGDEHCAKLLAFQKKHGLTFDAATSLVGGQSTGSGNKVRAVKDGTFRVAADMTHANQVVSITDRCREIGIVFATASAFVSAVSAVLRVPEFDAPLFLHRVSLNAAQMRKRSTVNDYLEEIEALYNYGAKERRIPLAFRAREVGRERALTFGRRPKSGTKKRKR